MKLKWFLALAVYVGACLAVVFLLIHLHRERVSECQSSGGVFELGQEPPCKIVPHRRP